jgi:hypothetical protein
MIDRVIDHFRDAVMPDASNVVWQVFNMGRTLLAPHPIF